MATETYTIQVIDGCWILYAPLPLNLAGWIRMGYAKECSGAVEDCGLAAHYKAAMAFGSKENIDTLKEKLCIATGKLA